MRLDRGQLVIFDCGGSAEYAGIGGGQQKASVRDRSYRMATTPVFRVESLLSVIAGCTLTNPLKFNGKVAILRVTVFGGENERG